ncbi:hypothetical protein Q1695_002513 [Nippostrongylus brasiliensis]|nr:hypothetical protein Q1695_002513 [Nippostrongylus brasiliensis]
MYLVICKSSENRQRPSLRFPGYAKRLQDKPIPELPSPFGNKVYLKNKLLNNLNQFFPNPSETLEVFNSEDSEPQHHERQEQQPMDTNSIVDPPPQPPTAVAPPPPRPFLSPIENLLENAFAPKVHNHDPFPTLIPTEATVAPAEPTTPYPQEATIKRRSEGPLVSGKMLDTIRDWRKKLYRAFKSKKTNKQSGEHVVDSSIARTSGQTNTAPTSEVVDLKDLTPMVVDKNRQVLLSRKEPNWQTALAARNVQTFGRDPDGKMVRLFGATESSSYQAKPLNDSPPSQIPSDYLPLSPLSSQRQAYRTPGGRNVVYIPASHVTIQPSPITAPSPTLPPLISFPFMPTTSMPDYTPQYNTVGQYPPQPQQQFNSFTNQAVQGFGSNLSPPAAPIYTTALPDSDLEEDSDDANEAECTGEMTCMNGQLVSEDKCNSLRLRTIIQNNIVPNDAEASKRAVQSAAESETGQYFDAVCGTGFFSYIAHTDEFCLASMAGVNCYVFAPVCSDQSTMIFAKARRSHKKVYLNKN